jgi:uncharacterized protein YbcI
MKTARDGHTKGHGEAPIMKFGSFRVWPDVAAPDQHHASSPTGDGRVSPVTHGGEISREITHKVVRCYRHCFGRGPTKAQTFYSGDVVVVMMRRVLTKAERLIAGKGCGDVVLGMREALNAGMRDSLAACVEEVLAKKVVAVMTSTDLAADAASCLFIVDGTPRG